MFTHSTSKVSTEHVNHIVKSILNKRQRNVLEQQQTFLRRNTDENNKRNNYLVDKFTTKKPTSSSKENVMNPKTTTTPKLISPKKKTVIEIDDDGDDDFVSTRKRPKIIEQPKKDPVMTKTDPVQECLDAIILEIENNDAICPICNQLLADLYSIDQRQEHVNRCLEGLQISHIETKHQKTLLAYPKFASTTRKPSSSTSASNFKCQICGTSFSVKRTYLSHLKKCSNQNSVQLKHVVNFAAKTTATASESKAPTTSKKKPSTTVKSRILKMETPITEDDEQQQLAIALSASIKTASEPPNAFDILQAAAKKPKTIDLLTTPLWNVSLEDKLKLSSTRLSNICERLISTDPSISPYQFPPSSLLLISQTTFGHVDWWNITTTDPQDDEIPMTQLARLLDDDSSA